MSNIDDLQKLIKGLRSAYANTGRSLSDVTGEELLGELEDALGIYPLLKEIKKREQNNNND